MHRGCRSTGTKAMKSAPSLLLADAAFGGSAADRGRENHSAPAQAARIELATKKCMCFIRPPSSESATGGFAFRSRKNCVGNCRGGARDARLSDASGFLVVVHYVGF